MKLKLSLLICLYGFFVACHSPGEKPKQAVKEKKPDTAKTTAKPAFVVAKVPLDFNGFWNYYTRYIKFYQDFVPHGVDGKVIGKADFLTQMKSELYLPLLLGSNDPKPHYQLSSIPKGADPNIGTYMRQFAADELKYYAMKGKPIPPFSFKDINGKLYTSANTKGKIVLFKCWFIGCVVCVQ